MALFSKKPKFNYVFSEIENFNPREVEDASDLVNLVEAENYRLTSQGETGQVTIAKVKGENDLIYQASYDLPFPKDTNFDAQLAGFYEEKPIPSGIRQKREDVQTTSETESSQAPVSNETIKTIHHSEIVQEFTSSTSTSEDDMMANFQSLSLSLSESVSQARQESEHRSLSESLTPEKTSKNTSEVQTSEVSETDYFSVLPSESTSDTQATTTDPLPPLTVPTPEASGQELSAFQEEARHVLEHYHKDNQDIEDYLIREQKKTIQAMIETVNQERDHKIQLENERHKNEVSDLQAAADQSSKEKSEKIKQEYENKRRAALTQHQQEMDAKLRLNFDHMLQGLRGEE